MQKFISWILSIVMLVMSFFGIGTGNEIDNMTKGQWIDQMTATVGLQVEEGKTAADACVEWEIISDDDLNDLGEAADAAFVFGTLKNAAKKLGVDYAELIKKAVAAGYINAKEQFLGDAKDAADASYAILGIFKELLDEKEVNDEAAKIAYAKNVQEVAGEVNGNMVVAPAGTDLAVGDVFTVPQTSGNLAGGIYEVVSVKETANGVVVETKEADLEDAIDSLEYAASFSPNMAAAQVVSGEGEVIQAGVANNEGIKETIDEVKGLLSDKEALKGKIKDLLVDTLSEGSFDIGDASVDYAFKDGGFDIAISGPVGKGINISKSYSVSNLELLTKFDASFKGGKTNVKEGYLKLNYDCVDTTRISGSYAASLVSGITDDISSLDVAEQIKMNFENLKMQEGTASFPVFTAHIAIPNAPSITIKMEASVVINVYGYAELIITTENCVGYEIIDNNGRFIFERNETAPKVFNAMGTAEALIGLNVGLCAFGIQLIDVGLEGGLGVYVYCTMTLPYDGNFVTTSIEDIPSNVLAQSIAILDNADEITVSGVADFYGVFRISLCENSITDKIGLSKTWTIVDHNNGGTFATITF